MACSSCEKRRKELAAAIKAVRTRESPRVVLGHLGDVAKSLKTDARIVVRRLGKRTGEQ